MTKFREHRIDRSVRENLLTTSLVVGAAVSVLAFCSKPAHAEIAPVGDSYMRGSNPYEIAKLIRKDLPTDPDGMKLLSPEKCHQLTGKSCATANSYLKSYQVHDPKAHLTSVSQLPEYFDSFVLTQPKPGSEYFMDCLKPVSGDVYDVVINCVSRVFKPNEPAYMNPRTGVLDLAFDCGNPVGQINEPIVVTAPPPCIKVYPNIPKGAVRLHGEVTGPRELVQSEKCPLPPDCNDHCDWRKINADLGVPDAKPLEEIGIHDPQQGMVILLPRDAEHEFTLVLCVDVRGSDGAIHRSVYKALAFHGSSPDEIHLGTFKFDGYVPE